MRLGIMWFRIKHWNHMRALRFGLLQAIRAVPRGRGLDRFRTSFAAFSAEISLAFDRCLRAGLLAGSEVLLRHHIVFRFERSKTICTRYSEPTRREATARTLPGGLFPRPFPLASEPLTGGPGNTTVT